MVKNSDRQSLHAYRDYMETTLNVSWLLPPLSCLCHRIPNPSTNTFSLNLLIVRVVNSQELLVVGILLKFCTYGDTFYCIYTAPSISFNQSINLRGQFWVQETDEQTTSNLNKESVLSHIGDLEVDTFRS